jgi:starvation-inducible DNA-binding protein
MTSTPTVTRSPEIPGGAPMGPEARAAVIGVLQPLLADHVMLYLTHKTHHWTVAGPRFRDLHLFFDECAEAVHGAVDPLAERIAALGGTPLVGLWHLGAHSGVPEPRVDRQPARASLTALASATQGVADRLRAAVATAEEAGDPGTADLLAGVLREREKEIWMLSAMVADER